ncbi:MAG: GTP-binding protein [Candidatus Lokiarchaeota archaeon]|nr:GTP-binding protein [Candidatus Lokiarchaeota archaeon]
MAKKFILKILTAGDGGVGKTTLLHRFVEGRFSSSTRMTIGVEFFLKDVEVGEDNVTLQLWDFGGQERFRFLLHNYVLGAKGAFLMFDLTRPNTLEKLQQWVDICRSSDPNLPILFLGTKIDLAEEIMIDDDYVRSFVDEFNMFDYLKVSSKTGENVDKAFQTLTRKVLDLK